MRKVLLIALSFFLQISLFAQKDTTQNQVENIKKGFSFGGLPVVAYDEDTGIRYGGLINIYHYGDGSNYPDYNHSLYLEWSKTTKGSGTMMINYDALTLIPKTRVSLIVGYYTEQTLNFYGFNGYNTYYNSDYEINNNPDYISRVYYRHSRNLFMTVVNFQGNIKGEKLRWLAGFAHYRTKVATVDIEKLNEGKDTNTELPATDLLYDKYVKWGVISDDQRTGGNVSFLKFGVVYDTRDNEANPNKGIWSEALILTAPGFIGNNYSYTKLLLTHRQYITLFPEKLTFAYRLSYQTKIAGEIPFYMLPYLMDSKNTSNGLGGATNLRGILRNRIVGEGLALGNMELRSKLYRGVIYNQNVYFGINVFTDMGIVTSPYNFTMPDLTAEDITQSDIDKLNYANEGLHISCGFGLRFAINSNFIIAADYGIALKKEDGTNGLYIGLNYLF